MAGGVMDPVLASLIGIAAFVLASAVGKRWGLALRRKDGQQ